MFPTMHINQTNHIEAKIDMELMFLSASNKLECLELIMSLDAEDRIGYLNQYVTKMAAIMGPEAVAELTETVWLMAA